MKEIKIRAFDKDRKRMVYYPALKEGEVFDEYIVGEPLLSSGHYDRKGKEVWEGDRVIWKDHPDHPGVSLTVAWKDAKLSLIMQDGECFFECGGMGASADLEVIGNVYENPEIVPDCPK